MKKKFSIGFIFLITYLGFLIATLPTTQLLNQFSLPKEIGVSGVTGTVWDTNIAQVIIGETSIQKVKSQLSFWSLFTLTPKLLITFGDPFIAGPEGEFELVLSSEKAKVNDLKLLVKANEVAQQLTLPLPISAQGDIELIVPSAEVDLKDNKCLALEGNAVWSKAGVIALEQNIKLGNFTADVNCEKGILALIISPKNDVGLTFSAYVGKGGNISGNGYLKPGSKFPRELNDALPFLGKKDSQGRYRLRF